MTKQTRSGGRKRWHEAGTGGVTETCSRRPVRHIVRMYRSGSLSVRAGPVVRAHWQQSKADGPKIGASSSPPLFSGERLPVEINEPASVCHHAARRGGDGRGPHGGRERTGLRGSTTGRRAGKRISATTAHPITGLREMPSTVAGTSFQGQTRRLHSCLLSAMAPVDTAVAAGRYSSTVLGFGR